MSLFGPTAARLLPAVFAGGAAVGVLLFGAGSAIADPVEPAPPGCTAADLARVSGNVATASSAYLYGHPDVNDFFTSLKGQRGDDLRGRIRDYMDANPQVHSDLRAIREPLTDLQNRCELAADPLVD